MSLSEPVAAWTVCDSRLRALASRHGSHSHHGRSPGRAGGTEGQQALSTYLDRILDSHRQAAAADARSLDVLLDQLAVTEAGAGPARGFRRALADADPPAVIAEIKRRSPSRGDLFVDLDPARLAREYASGGASCLSVLTDVDWFSGSPEDLRAARRAVPLPVLRKDFAVDPRDVIDARLMGADCVLLIAAALDAAELADFRRLACEVGIDALIEIHGEADLDRALAVDADLIGVNQRDLMTFEVDPERARRMAPLIPPGIVRVAESGVQNRADARILADAGYHAVLVGESLVRAADPTAHIRRLRGR